MPLILSDGVRVILSMVGALNLDYAVVLTIFNVSKPIVMGLKINVANVVILELLNQSSTTFFDAKLSRTGGTVSGIRWT